MTFKCFYCKKEYEDQHEYIKHDIEEFFDNPSTGKLNTFIFKRLGEIDEQAGKR